MAIYIFCSKCHATRELKHIKQTQNLIRGTCKKCGAIIVKDSSKAKIIKPITEKVTNITEKIQIGPIYSNNSHIINQTTRNIEVIKEAFRQSSEINFVQRMYNNSYSVIIGIDDYKEEQSLSNACNDARSINRVLENDYKFINLIPPLYNSEATKDKLEEIFVDTISNNQGSKEMGQQDRLIIYYSGHGKLRKITNLDGTKSKEGFIIPYDGKKGGDYKNISMETIIKSCQRCIAKHVLLILDCCYSGFAATRSSIDNLQQIDNRYLDDLASRRAIQVLADGQDDQLVSDSGIRQGHSAFTGALLDILENKLDLNNDGIISVREIAYYLETQVAMHSSLYQRPVYNEIAGSQNGDFLFKI